MLIIFIFLILMYRLARQLHSLLMYQTIICICFGMYFNVLTCERDPCSVYCLIQVFNQCTCLRLATTVRHEFVTSAFRTLICVTNTCECWAPSWPEESSKPQSLVSLNVFFWMWPWRGDFLLTVLACPVSAVLSLILSSLKAYSCCNIRVSSEERGCDGRICRWKVGSSVRALSFSHTLTARRRTTANMSRVGIRVAPCARWRRRGFM